MNQRRSPRLLPGPDNSTITLRKANTEQTLSGSLLDQSVDGIAVQLGRRCELANNDQVEVLVGNQWEPATISSTKRQGIAYRVGLCWVNSNERVNVEVSV